MFVGISEELAQFFFLAFLVQLFMCTVKCISSDQTDLEIVG